MRTCTFRYDASMYLYRDLYSLFGSYELLKLKFQLDLPLYYHIWLYGIYARPTSR